MVANQASASLYFPIVGGWDIANASIEGLVIEGNRNRQITLDGCRGGGIYLFQSRQVAIRNCVVRNVNGDGISFQVSPEVLVEDCVSEGNAGQGIHPGSGSQKPVVRNCRSIRNGRDGLYVCWRVKHGRFEGNELVENRGAGISIGHKDTDNRFVGNRIKGNEMSGVVFRAETAPMGAHRNVFERNFIVDNGGPAVSIQGHHEGLIFRQNTMGNRRSLDGKSVGFSMSPGAEPIRSEDNHFQNVRSLLRGK
jgi:nitrous oxidase accessory protein NosD